MQPAALAEAGGEVDVLEVHEVAGIEAADGVEGLQVDQEAGARQPPGGPLAGSLPLAPVARRPGVGRPRPSRTARGRSRSRGRAGRGPRGRARPSGVRMAGPDGRRPRPAGGHGQQLVDARRARSGCRGWRPPPSPSRGRPARRWPPGRSRRCRRWRSTRTCGWRAAARSGAPSVEPLSARTTSTGRVVAARERRQEALERLPRRVGDRHDPQRLGASPGSVTTAPTLRSGHSGPGGARISSRGAPGRRPASRTEPPARAPPRPAAAVAPDRPAASQGRRRSMPASGSV